MKQEATGTFVYALRNGIIILIPHLFRKHMCRHKTISRGLIKGAVRPRLFKAVGVSMPGRGGLQSGHPGEDQR